MAKFCANGHQMEDTWEVCPYCQRSGYEQGLPPVTVKTRLQSDPRHEAAPQSGRKGLLIEDKPKLPVVGWFVALTGPQKGEDFRIREGPNTIGSAPDADIVLLDEAISGKHASLRYKDRKFTITDLDSTNGTFLNDRSDPIAREELKDNDVIRLGEVTLKLKCL
jgi:hypothetical protein